MAERQTSLVGKSAQMVRVRNLIGRVSGTAVPVLITGETGTGKDVVAEELYRCGGSKGHLVSVNCANLHESIADSQLFGHERGAFTDAKLRHTGFIAEADRGTLFLDEIAELATPLQGKLLRVLETREFRPLGGEKNKRSSFRLIAATSRDLEDLVAGNLFRADLFYRLGAIRIDLPPLRDRPEDIIDLALHFVDRLDLHSDLRLSKNAQALLVGYRWPGNVRQLRTVVEAAATTSGGEFIGATQLAWLLEHRGTNGGPNGEGRPRMLPTLKEAVAEAEAHAIQTALAATGGNRNQAAEILQISPATLYRRMENQN